VCSWSEEGVRMAVLPYAGYSLILTSYIENDGISARLMMRAMSPCMKNFLVTRRNVSSDIGSVRKPPRLLSSVW